MLISPAEDFSERTLAAVSGTLGKLEYLSGLRRQDGEYFHWGMARSYGEPTASVAIAEAHSKLFLSILRTPIRELWEEESKTAHETGGDIREIITRLQDRGDQLLPLDSGGGARHHFNSVLLALCCLAGILAPKTGQAA